MLQAITAIEAPQACHEATMTNWKKFYFKLEEGLGLVFFVILGLSGLAFATSTFGLVGAVLLYVLLGAAIVLVAWVLFS